jgi:hypothetical protein
MKLKHIVIGILLCGFCSCVVTAPRYTTVEKVFELKLGMSKDSVNQILGTGPYLLKAMNDTGSTYLYKYRVTDRSTVPFFMGATNGHNILGKYVNLLITYDQDGKVTNLESCGNECDETVVETKGINIDKIVTFFSVTVPLALVLLGVTFGVKF